MKKISILITTLSLISSLANAASNSDKYIFDPTHTSATWSANHFGFSNPSGKFSNIEGELILDEKHPNKSSVNVKINIAGINTANEKFDNHLKSEDFFNVKKFSTANFLSKKIVITGKNSAKVYGDLTFMGISKEIILNVKLNKIGINPIVNKKTAGFSANATIKRSDFGINYALPAIADEVKISIEAEANLSE